MSVAKHFCSSLSSSTRAVILGGNAPSLSDIIEYVTIASTGDVTDFGDLADARRQMSGVSNKIRGVTAGGGDPATDVMEYITIASTGDGADFGDLQEAVAIPSGFSDAGGHL